MWLDRDPINVPLLCFFTLLPFRYGFSHPTPIDRLLMRSGRSGSVMQYETSLFSGFVLYHLSFKVLVHKTEWHSIYSTGPGGLRASAGAVFK